VLLQDTNDKIVLLVNSFKVLELDDEVIVREIIENKIQK
jgi:hypothetical protein